MPRPGIAEHPLPSQGGNEGCKEGKRQTRVEGTSDADDGGIGAIPFRESTSWYVPRRGAGNNLEEVVVHFLEIRLELALNIND